jgi:hypothetical protein
MAQDELGARRQPHFFDGGGADIAVDDNLVSDYAARFAFQTSGTKAEREAFQDLGWEGLIWYDTTAKADYRHNGSVWKLWNTTVPIEFTPSWGNINVNNGVQDCKYTVSAGRVFVDGRLAIGSATVLAGEFFPSLPLPKLASSPTVQGTAWAFDVSATAWYQGAIVKGEYNYFMFPGGRAFNAFPFVFDEGDLLLYSYNYMAA